MAGTNSQLGHEEYVRPIISAAIAPTASWPAAPILKRPARKAIATERLVKMSGVTLTSVFEKFIPVPNEPEKRVL